MVSQEISPTGDRVALITCLCVAVVAVAMRAGARWYKRRKVPLDSEDLFIYLALASFAIMTALYLATITTFFNVSAVTAGLMAPYPSLQEDVAVMLKEFFVVQFFFWLTLWAVKWSLLFMFRRLTEGIQLYRWIWWGILVYSVLTFIGCCISNFTSCSSMDAWFSGNCLTDRDNHAKAISLWFSLAADLSTDLLIMATPLRVLWNLKMSLVEKISVGLVFVVGIVTMITAIIRSVSLDSSASSGQVSTTWLMLWAGVEGAVAIIVGCLPSFAIFIRGRVTASRARYEGSSNIISSGCYSGKSRGPAGSVRIPDEAQPWKTGDSASDTGLVEGGGITVTRSWSQNWHGTAGQRASRLRGEDPGHELDTMRRI